MSHELFKSCLYFSNWSVYERKHFAIDIDVRYVTHLMYAFLKIDHSGRLQLTDPWCDTDMPLDSVTGEKVHGNLNQLWSIKNKHRHLKVLASIGGWGAASSFKAMVDSHKKMQKFIESSVEMVKKYGFDGIDIDWEYPENEHEAQQLERVLFELKEALNNISPQLLLTMASPAGEQLKVLNLQRLDKYLDFWNVMCYDFNGESWSEKVGYHSNLFGSNGGNCLNASDVLSSYTKRGIDPKRLVMGIPLYGRVFHGANSIGDKFSGSRTKHSISGDIIDFKKINQLGIKEEFDCRKVSAWAHDLQNNQLIVYDNKQSVRIKAQYIKLKGFGGGMFWDSAGDSCLDLLIESFVNQLGGVQSLDYSSNITNIYEKSAYLD